MGLRKELNKLSREEIIFLLDDLLKLSKENREFMELKLNKDDEDILRYYKDKIKKSFSEKNLSLKSARKAINNFKKILKRERYLIELMVYYVECATDLESEFGDLWEAFYTAVENMFEDCIKILNKNSDLIPSYKERLEKVISKSCEGWGHRDILEENLGELKE